ncbi:MAG: hypothetical protein ACHQ7M_03005 [Chloroflexota bacterium]
MEYLDQLRNLGRRLADANAGLIAWDSIEGQGRLPKAAGGESVKRPRLSRRALKLQLILLMADMSRLEQEIGMAAVLSAN